MEEKIASASTYLLRVIINPNPRWISKVSYQLIIIITHSYGSSLITMYIYIYYTTSTAVRLNPGKFLSSKSTVSMDALGLAAGRLEYSIVLVVKGLEAAAVR